ncbi:terminase small subunit [Niveispirillum lacus]|uniref:terminase small subunit n=1 Tax=Niveispirillum lacus TaxID=1981099 RepID=UPI0013FDE30D|nr:terminase small subunit [Niveispirillum lacus]
MAVDDCEADDGAVPGGRYVSLSQLAMMTGRSRNTIRAWIADGMPVHQRPDNAADGGGWQIDIAAVIAWREERARAAAGMDDDSLMDKEEAQRRKLSAEARMAEYQLARVRQETLMLADVVQIVSEEYSEVRARLRSLPARVSQTLAGADGETLFREMRKEIDVALEALGYDAAIQRQADDQHRNNQADGGDDENRA